MLEWQVPVDSRPGHTVLMCAARSSNAETLAVMLAHNIGNDPSIDKVSLMANVTLNDKPMDRFVVRKCQLDCFCFNTTQDAQLELAKMLLANKGDLEARTGNVMGGKRG